MEFSISIVFTLIQLLGVFQVRSNELDPTFVAQKWAPEVRLASGEPWLPSSVDYFLKHVDLKGASVSPLTANTLPECNRDCYLKTKIDLDCNSCTNVPVFHGQNPSKVPAYAIYRVSSIILTIRYLFFYPYNRGKRVCIGLFDKKGFWFVKKLGCIGGYSTFGHHVGDWEDIKITLMKRGNTYVPFRLYVSAHNFGFDYIWNGNRFRRGLQTVSMTDNTHPIVYSAAGSHGNWATSGTHRYKNLPNGHYLQDECSDGTRWKTWNNLKVVKKGDYKGEFSFFKFKGRWGNQKKGCGLIESISGECMLNNGPTGP